MEPKAERVRAHLFGHERLSSHCTTYCWVSNWKKCRTQRSWPVQLEHTFQCFSAARLAFQSMRMYQCLCVYLRNRTMLCNLWRAYNSRYLWFQCFVLGFYAVLGVYIVINEPQHHPPVRIRVRWRVPHTSATRNRWIWWEWRQLCLKCLNKYQHSRNWPIHKRRLLYKCSHAFAVHWSECYSIYLDALHYCVSCRQNSQKVFVAVATAL